MQNNITTKLKFGVLLCFNLFIGLSSRAQQPVIATHPRVMLNGTVKAALLVKKNNNDADWLATLADANKYLPGQVIPWNTVSAADAQYYGTANIFYSYCGSSWQDATMALGLAHQLTKTNNAGANPTSYSNKLLQLADVIIQAYATYPPNASGGPNIFQYNSSYATRHVGKTIAVIYDWCYDELGATRKAALLNVMKNWFTYMSSTPFSVNQLQDGPTGNYFAGQLICAGYMGYAIAGDDPLSQKMIDFARQRIIGTPGSLNPNTQTSGETAYNYFTQAVKGGLPSGASQSYLGPHSYVAAPQKDGIPNQGWSYGGETTQFLTDFITTIKTATGEDLLQTDVDLKAFFAKTSTALVHATFPNHFQLDNSNDNGSFVGSVMSYALPLRLTALLEGTPEGANVEYFYKNLVKPVNLLSGNKGYPALNWEKFYYSKTRASTVINFKPYYPATATNVYNAVPINSGMHKFYMRKDWSAGSTWASVMMGIGTYDQHNHNHAGHFKIVRGDSHDGDDHLLVGANEVSKSGGNGIDGPTNYSYSNSFSNTLFVNDYNDYDTQYPNFANTVGNQNSFGYDAPTNEEQNDNFSYFRADLTSAYLVSYSNPDTTKRTVRYYYRSFLYLRNSDIFVVYDKFMAKNSTNAAGQYKKHLRWHFLQPPVVNGSNITATQDNSKLYIHTVLPATVDVVTVNENTNPDNTFGSGYNYAFNTNTWRTEVNTTGNPLREDIVTVLQPGAKTTSVEMVTTAIKTTQNNMEGSIVKANGNDELVLFNNNIAKYPAPVTLASYPFTGPITTNHTLCGLAPGQNYIVAYSAVVVTVTKAAAGTHQASPSGVLTFTLQGMVLSNNANLSNLTLSSGVLTPVFSPGTVAYTATVSNATATIKITPFTSDAAASVKVNGTAVASGAATANLPLVVGANVINAVVTAQDGTTIKTYKLTVTRAKSNNAALSSIKLSPLSTLTSTSGPASVNYVTSVAPGITSVTVTPTVQVAGATIKVNGVTVASGAASGPIALNAGPTVVNLVVTAQDGVTQKTYTITVNRTGSSNPALSAIKLNPTAILTRTTGPSNSNYFTSVSPGTTSVKITPTAQDAGTIITVNGATTASGVASTPITLNAGPTVIDIIATAQDGVTKKTYSVTVNRTGSTNAALSSIKLSPAAVLTTIAGPANTNYSASVPAGTASVKVIATVQDAEATIVINAATVASGVASAPIPLNATPTVINITVTAPDGINKKTYAINVSVAAPIIIIAGNITKHNLAGIDMLEAENEGIKVHPGLSPNGDGVNDYLQIDGLEVYKDNKLTIMARNGQVIYEVNGYNNDTKRFDGLGKNGRLQSPGTYLYVLEYKADGVVKRKTGYILMKY
ncbi:cadherin-like beta sandwich domain-containing protein [Mucilaginibacter flavidus]|uniref:cadherin-like beta sandwich domain-containing protein n=1 Tax=Mucilaginibacter flavidus TaxID=2949309 RepID=UPI002093333B|nr:cadherin-like beta sandwich domain-containing protein [Mucilaginibacter flavidus]MCO5950322.1 cadherin-like beta sandwich domain-containing protein [Mucilaginibacter flavidus]